MQVAFYADARVNMNTFTFWRQSRGLNLFYSHTMLRDSADTMGSHSFLHAENQLALPPGTAYLGIFFFFWKQELKSLSLAVSRSMPPFLEVALKHHMTYSNNKA